jgi:nickel-dependent lactate racemase
VFSVASVGIRSSQDAVNPKSKIENPKTPVAVPNLTPQKRPSYHEAGFTTGRTPTGERGMHLVVDFGSERLDFELADEQVAGVWHGPESLSSLLLGERLRAALEEPLEFPPLRQNVVPGDHVVIPIDPDLPHLVEVLGAVHEALREGGVATADMRIVSPRPPSAALQQSALREIGWTVHDPDNRSELAYLASTAQGRRVYLNRGVTDADCVVPIGRLGYDPVLGYRGPWSVVFPNLSDSESLRSLRAHATLAKPDRAHERHALKESADVNWLLGTHFHVGIVPGARGGISRVVAGAQKAVREAGMRSVDELWDYHAVERAELVVVGLGKPEGPARIDDLAEGLATASRLVRTGGKIVALSRVGGPIGPALHRLANPNGERPGPGALRGAEGEADYPAARQVAHALATADIYLLSDLDQEGVADLGIIPLDRPEEARRLASASRSCHFVSQAELTRAETAED